MDEIAEALADAKASLLVQAYRRLAKGHITSEIDDSRTMDTRLGADALVSGARTPALALGPSLWLGSSRGARWPCPPVMSGRWAKP
jgi:hypothetical protein